MIEWVPYEPEFPSVTVKAGEAWEITVEVQRPGPVVLRAVREGSWLSSLPFQVELVRDGKAVCSRAGLIAKVPVMCTHMVQETSTLPCLMTLRVSNRSRRPQQFHLKAEYPSTIPIRTVVLPVSVLNGAVDNVLDKAKLHLTAGENASFIDVDLPGIGRHTFTVGTAEDDERPNDINSTAIWGAFDDRKSGYPLGVFELKATFEDDGMEVLGDWDVQMADMELSVALELMLKGKALCYRGESVKATFKAKTDVQWLPEWMVDTGPEIRAVIEENVEQAFRSGELYDLLSQTLHTLLCLQLGRLDFATTRIFGFSIEGGTVTVRVA